MADLRWEDVVASFEDYLSTNWPDPAVGQRFSARESAADTSTMGVDPDDTVEAVWLASEEFESRAAEDWIEFDVNLLCRARSNDPSRATLVADDMRLLLRNATMGVRDRTDGSTLLGWIRIRRTNIIPARLELASGQQLAVCQVVGWAHNDGS